MALILANTVASDTFRILVIPRIPIPSTTSFLMDVLVIRLPGNVFLFFKLILTAHLTIELLRTILLTTRFDTAAIAIHAFHHLIICSTKVRRTILVGSGTTFLKVHEQECPSSANSCALLLIDYQQLRKTSKLHLIVWCITSITGRFPSNNIIQRQFSQTQFNDFRF